MSNGPGEDVVELNIRALGSGVKTGVIELSGRDHTREIVALAKDRAVNPK